MTNIVETEYPAWALLPKKETGITSFLTKYPDYDGRGIVIAIFDSGVDPGAPGLKTTSDGKVKVIERFDCSGCGDVDTATIVTAEDGYITGLSGRKLKIPEAWVNPTNSYRIGIKRAFDLYPDGLRDRYQEEYKERNWDNLHKTALGEANRNLANLESTLNSTTNLTETQKLVKEDKESTVEFLYNFEKKYTDLGPVYDCVLFHDGNKWNACVDTTEKGELSECRVLGEYSITRDYAPLTEIDQLNYSMNVHNDGDVLELVGLCSSHGTHVASISSAYFPDQPELNGIAPGAQIISLTIGDGRLGSMETGTALVRAMIKVMELQETTPVHVINMSYGEHAHWSNSGRIGELMNEVVNKYGVVWVASAGNHGPALSTVGTPPDISQETIIGVGAYVSPEMMVAEYSMRQKLPGTPYTWSSRGPTIDGGFGVTVCAPGGAITSVPNFTLRNSQLMNGTSMASPHVAGAVSVLLSGLNARKITYSPYSVKRALENSATKLTDVEFFAQGHGLLQVERAFEHLVTYGASKERDVRFHISCGTNNTKGVYVRKPESSSIETVINVEPCFKYNKDIATGATSKIAFNLRLALVCNATYVNHPSHLDMSNMTRSFYIRIDTGGLANGVHSTSIDAYDVAAVEKGPAFRVPITVIIPQQVSEPTYIANFNDVSFLPNVIKRHFILVPDLATWGVIRLRSQVCNAAGHFVVHCMQILPKQSCKTLEINKHLTVTSNNESVLGFPVKGRLVLEVVVAKYWANIGELTIDYCISFHGIKPSQPNISMLAADGIYSLDVTSLQGEEIVPSISFKNSVQILKPSDSKIVPLTERDVIPPCKQIYELNLTYSFHLNKATEVCPNSPLLSDVLYESEFESQLWMLYDSNKQFLGCGDAYPSKYTIKLSKGDYTIKMHIRHDKKDYLEKLSDTPLLLNQKLANPIALDVYNSHSQAVIGGKKAVFGHMLNSATVPLYIAPLPADKFNSKNNNAAQYLTGTITYAKDELGKKADTYQIKYILHEQNKKANNTKSDKEKNRMDEYKEALKDLKVQWITKFEDGNTSDDIYGELLKEYPDSLDVYMAYLQCVDPFEPKNQLPPINERPDSVVLTRTIVNRYIAICDEVIDQVDQDKLLAFFAIKVDFRVDANQIKSQMDKQKSAFIEAICRKGIYLCTILELGEIMEGDDDLPTTDDLNDGINDLWHIMLLFYDPTDTKVTNIFVLYFALWHSLIKSQYGRVLKYLTRIQEEKATKDVEEKIIAVCAMKSWNHLVRYLQRGILSKFPTAYKPF